MKKRTILFLSLCLLLLNGCAPGLGTTIEVSTIPEIGEQAQFSSLRQVRVHVKPFIDARARTGSIMVNDRAVTIEGEIGSVVQSGFEEAIRSNGGSLCLFDCTTITGEIVVWEMQVTPVFPVSKVTSKATIKVSLLTRDGKTIYTGTYTGKMSGEHPYYNEERLLDAFGTAMKQAIEASLRDTKLINGVLRQ